MAHNQQGLPRRIIKETSNLASDKVPGIECKPDESNMRHFRVKITGPKDSPYEGGSFELELFLPEDYPMAPPKVSLIKYSLLIYAFFCFGHLAW